MSIITKKLSAAAKSRARVSAIRVFAESAKVKKATPPLQMKSPPHPGGLLRDTLDEFGLSIAQAAEGLGVTRQQLHNVCTGRSAMTPDMAVRLERALGGSAEIWMTLQLAFDLAAARASAPLASITRFPPRAA